MANEVVINKRVYNRGSFEQNVNSSFSYFTVQTPVEDPDTVTELFRLYDKFFYQLPAEGKASHQTLVERSSQIYTVPLDNSVIQPLLDEIADLRAQLLTVNEENLELLKLVGNG